jgi:sulfur-carrier protein
MNPRERREGLREMTIFIPTPLRQFTANKDAVEVNAATIAGALDELTAAYPDRQKHLFTSEGKLRAFVNIYLNDEDVRYLPEKDATNVAPTDTLSIIPSIAGGCFSLERAQGRHRIAETE